MEKRFFSKKILAFLLAAIMLAALLPISSMAATCPTCGGTGTLSDGADCPNCENGEVPDDTPPELSDNSDNSDTTVCKEATCVDYNKTVAASHTHTTVPPAPAPVAPQESSDDPETDDCEYCGTGAGHTTAGCPNWESCDAEYCTAYNTRVEKPHEHTKKTFTVSFKNNGDLIGSAQTIEYGGAATAPNLPEGATGWDTGFANVTSDLTVNAVFPAAPAPAPAAPQAPVVIVDEVVDIPVAEVNTYYDENTEEKIDVTPQVAPPAPEEVTPGDGTTTCGNCGAVLDTDGNCTATFTVTFKNNEGDTLSTETVACNGSAPAPALPENASRWDKAFDHVTSVLTVTAVLRSASTVSVSGSITWPTDDTATDRPLLVITLRQNDSNIKYFRTDDATSYSFTGLPEFDGSGNAYSYSIKVPKKLNDSYTVSHDDSNISVAYRSQPVEVQNNEDPGTSSSITEIGGNVRWDGLPSSAASNVMLLLKRGDETLGDQEITGNNSTNYCFDNLEPVNDEGVPYTLADYSVSATASDVEGYAEPTVTISRTNGSFDFLITYQLAEDTLAALVEQFVAPINALPTATEIEALKASADEADQASFNSFKAVFESAKALYTGLSETDRTAFEEKVGTEVMDKYNALAEAFADNRLRAAASSNISVSMVFVPTNDADDTPTGIGEVRLLCTPATGNTQTWTPSISAGSKVRTFGHTFENLPDGSEATGKANTYTVVWPTVPGYVGISGDRSIIYKEVAASSTATVKVGVRFQGGPPDNATVSVTRIPDTAAFGGTNGWGVKTLENVALTANSNLNPVVTGTNVDAYLAPQISKEVTVESNVTIITYDIYYQVKLPATTISGEVKWCNAEEVWLTTGVQDVTIYLNQRTWSGAPALYAAAKVPAGDNKYTFFDIPTQDVTGAPLYYSVSASSVPNYSVEIDGLNSVTYYANSAYRTHLNVKVSWDDSQNKRGLRPIETTVYVYRGSELVRAKQVNDVSNWSTTFGQLDRYDAAGHFIEYTVRAANIAHYWTDPVAVGANTGVTATYHYGYRSASTTGSTGTTPKVGDPTLFRTQLTDNMYAAAAQYAKDLARIARANETVTGASDIDFDTLKRINPDVAAWITIDDTVVDYPIVRGDNNSDYMTRLFSGEANSSGTLFMDYHNNRNFSNRNTTVFGHNMKDGSMFNALTEYRNQAFYDAHKSFTIQTPDGDYTVEPVAGFFTDAAYSNVVKRTFANNQAFLKYIDKCLNASDFQSDASVTATDKLITFVTCTEDYSASRRFLLVCKLTPEN